MQWDTDLIGYDALHSYGSPSYYAQVLFAGHIGTETPASSIEGAGPRFFYSVTQDSAKKQLYLKLVNGSSDPQSLQVRFPGAKLAPSGRLISLTAHNPEATNSINQPTSVAPVETALPTPGNSLRFRTPAYSIEVLEITLQ
jgi:alpha-N-arabinofuranosidase